MCPQMQPELSVDVSVEHTAAVVGAVPTHRKILLKERPPTTIPLYTETYVPPDAA